MLRRRAAMAASRFAPGNGYSLESSNTSPVNRCRRFRAPSATTAKRAGCPVISKDGGGVARHGIAGALCFAV
jgi:hypothetical protein